MTDALVDLAMPRLSDSMEHGTIVRWLLEPGDRFARGDPLVEVETDKASVVHESEIAGVLAEIVTPVGETVALGATIARVATSDPRAAVGAASAPAVAATTAPRTAGAPLARGPRAQASPVARRLAAELGVDLLALAGTGPGGRITRSDVERATPEPAAVTVAPSGRGETFEVPLSPVRRTIAERMERSRREIPDFTVEAEIDMEECLALRAQLKELALAAVPSLNDLLIAAVARCLREDPTLNATYEGGRTLRHGRINVGMAVATDDALLVPTVHDADARSIFEIARESRRLAAVVRDRSIAPSDLADGTITVSNLGMFGVRRFGAIINHPQVAILAAGEVAAPRGVARGRRTMDLALSCDHRAVYGADAARFLQRLRTLLERPVGLLVPADEARTA